MTEAEILDLLEKRYSFWREEWVFFRHVRVGAGWGLPWERTMDAWAMNCYPSRDFRSIAFEVKVSRSDFLKELKDPGKRAAAYKVSNQIFFVAPSGLLKVAEIPEDSGLIVAKNGRLRQLKRAPCREREGLDVRFIVSILRQAKRNER